MASYDEEEVLIDKLRDIFRAPNPKVKQLIALFVDALHEQYPEFKKKVPPNSKPKNKVSKSKALHH